MLEEEERKLLLEEWNATEAEYPEDKCVHELFEEQVRRTPEAVAVEYERGAVELWGVEPAGQSAGDII